MLPRNNVEYELTRTTFMFSLGGEYGSVDKFYADNLNTNQNRAVHTALTNSLSLIEGPPGNLLNTSLKNESVDWGRESTELHFCVLP